MDVARERHERRIRALAVPPATGGNQLIYLAPLAAIVAGAAVLIAVLRRWSRKSAADAESAATAAGAPTTKASRDEYDDKLDDELRRMDDE